MAAPTINGTPTSGSSMFTQTHTVNLPTGITAGELLFVVCDIEDGATLTTPSGWQRLDNFPLQFATSYRLYAFIKTAAGSDTCVISSSASSCMGYVAYRLSMPDGLSIQPGSETTGSNPDSPSLTLPASYDTLWFSLVGDGQSAGFTSGPTSYTKIEAAARFTTVGTAYRTLTAQTENPGAYTRSGSYTYITATLGFYKTGAPTGTGAVTAPKAEVAALGTQTVNPTGTGAVTAPKAEALGWYPGYPTIHVYIDFDNDGSFATSGDDVTDTILAAEGVSWERGRSADFSGDVIGTASFVLKNTTGVYTSDPDLVPGRPVLITATHAGTEYPRFYGYIQRVTPSATLGGPVTVTCYDPLRKMQDTPVAPRFASTPTDVHALRVEVLNEFERGALNSVVNPGFTSTTDDWEAINGTLTRVTGDHPASLPDGCGNFVAAGAHGIVGAKALLMPIVREGETYRGSIWLRSTTGAPVDAIISLGYRNTNPRTTDTVVIPTTWTRYSLTYAPTEERQPGMGTGNEYLILYVDLPYAGSIRVGWAQVTRGPEDHPYGNPGTGRWPSFLDEGWEATGPASTMGYTSDEAKYGASCVFVVTNGSGSGLQTRQVSPLWVGGQAYTGFVWLKAADAAPYDVLFGVAGTTDHAHTTGTLTAGTWQKVNVTWTPSDDRLYVDGVYLRVTVTDAAARTLYLDGARIIPGNTADDFEMAHWSLPYENIAVRLESDITGQSALAALATLNTMTLSRHYVVATASAPYYRYVCVGREELADKTVVETFDGDFRGFDSADVDVASVVNLLSVATYDDDLNPTVEWYSDPDSVAKYGVRPGSAVGGSGMRHSRTNAAIIGGALIARYKDPRGRPSMVVDNRFPSQLVRELDDLISVTLDRLSLTDKKYIIVRTSSRVGAAGLWTTTWGLEEYPF